MLLYQGSIAQSHAHMMGARTRALLLACSPANRKKSKYIVGFLCRAFWMCVCVSHDIFSCYCFFFGVFPYAPHGIQIDTLRYDRKSLTSHSMQPESSRIGCVSLCQPRAHHQPTSVVEFLVVGDDIRSRWKKCISIICVCGAWFISEQIGSCLFRCILSNN